MADVQYLVRLFAINLECVITLSDNRLVPFNTYSLHEPRSLVELDVEQAACHAIDLQFSEAAQSIISIGSPSRLNYSSTIYCCLHCYMVCVKSGLNTT